jgi:hypothetical protein
MKYYNYWIFRLCPMSVILNIRKDNVSETGCFCPQVRGVRQMGPLERTNLNQLMLCFPVFRMPDDGELETQ